jgi:CO/xanthine dehydrogenase FAD-binding subunit
MLLNLREVHRPGSETGAAGVDAALRLLARPGIRTIPVAGGDWLLGSADGTVEAVVELQGLGMDALAYHDTARELRIGAMATRAQLAGWEPAVRLGRGLLADAARNWRGSLQRNRDTVGGAVAVAASEDPLVAALMVLGAEVRVRSLAGETRSPLPTFTRNRREILATPALILELIVPVPAGRFGAAMERVGRTPADRPIVLAAASLRAESGICVDARLALGGVGSEPVLAAAAERLIGQQVNDSAIAGAASAAASALEPAGDERGSAAYRLAMAEVLARRALAQAWSRC